MQVGSRPPEMPVELFYWEKRKQPGKRTFSDFGRMLYHLCVGETSPELLSEKGSGIWSFPRCPTVVPSYAACCGVGEMGAWSHLQVKAVKVEG